MFISRDCGSQSEKVVNPNFGQWNTQNIRGRAITACLCAHEWKEEEIISEETECGMYF